jgi:exopolysaccharide biosynthesis WecB/TagA/CpsF family protein
MVVADGHPVVWLSHLAGHPVKLAPGSELILPLCEVARQLDARVALVGTTVEALQRASARLQAAVPGLNICATIAPSQSFDPHGIEADAILGELSGSGTQLCFLALGAPKQELFAARSHEVAPQIGFVSVGAGLDFIAGHQRRAPRLVRGLALEWLWRTLENPRRMAPRYARCFLILPRLTALAIGTRLWRR